MVAQPTAPAALTIVAPPSDHAIASAKQSLTPIQVQVLQGLLAAGGSCPYKQLFRACYGVRWEDMPSVERSRLGVSVRGLDKKGLVEIARRWGTWGYGQPETVTITQLGRAVGETL